MDFMRLDRGRFTQINGISIDYAVMEHTDKAAVVPAEMGWSDVGAWDALWDISNKDENGNVLTGNVVTENVRNSYIRTDKQWVAAAGLQDTIVVSTDDAVLVAAKGEAQQVRELVAQLETFYTGTTTGSFCGLPAMGLVSVSGGWACIPS